MSRFFQGITKTKGKEKLRVSGGLSYTCMRELVLMKFREMGYAESDFVLQSFRAGGATVAANNPNRVSMVDVRIHYTKQTVY